MNHTTIVTDLFRRNWLIVLVFVAGVFTAQMTVAKVRLPQFIGDKMVLQRDIDLNIWGWADAGEKVTIRFQGKHYYTEADREGKWFVLLPPQQAGGPFIMEINEIIIRDILIGDVWLASGQSNMETPIARLVDRYPEINVSNNHMIRHFKVPTQETVEDVKDEIGSGAKWYSAVASEVMNWTALAYFYAQEAYAHTEVPIGLLVSSKGGSSIQSWVSQEHLKDFPDLLVNREALNAQQEAESDKGTGKWNRRDWDDSDWQTMEIPSRWREKGIEAKGVVWYRKDFEIPTSMEGRHAKLYMGMMIDSDSVIINGHFVGHTSYSFPPRKYDIPAGVLRNGKNTITVRLTANNGNGGFVPDKPYKIVGENMEVDLTGEWKYRVGLDLREVEQLKPALSNLHTVGSGLYNGMIYPLRDYRVKGVIWYQGESNSGQVQYEQYMKALINNWRELYKNPELPFLLVQLPNYLPKPDTPPLRSGWASIREAQLKTTLEVPHTALAVTYDIGEWNDIHPLNKKDMARRLFLGARKVVHGEQLVSSGPLYKNIEINGDKILIYFSEIGGGLRSREGKLRHFAIAGEDKKFVWADAEIKGNTVIVTSSKVKNPVAVRYAWSDNPEEANLINEEGLLASPFRTDSW